MRHAKVLLRHQGIIGTGKAVSGVLRQEGIAPPATQVSMMSNQGAPRYDSPAAYQLRYKTRASFFPFFGLELVVRWVRLSVGSCLLTGVAGTSWTLPAPHIEA
jgi:hypothetical protein